MDESQRKEAIQRLYLKIFNRKAEDLEAIHSELLEEIKAQAGALEGGGRKKRGGRDRMERGGEDREG